jgi:uncharacterized heparinase superfamily protein
MALSRSNARSLVDEWIRHARHHDRIAWEPEVVARRLIAWLSQAPLVLDGCDLAFYRRYMRSLNAQTRYLRRVAFDGPPGLPRLRVTIALASLALSMPDQPRFLKQAARWLDLQLVAQVLPDGGHIGRNPGAILDALIDLLPLRQAFTARGREPSRILVSAIDRMMPMLRFFRHGDGVFTHFNGMGPTPSELVATLLAYDDARGVPVANAAHSGYQRIEAGDRLVVMDTGKPPPVGVSSEAHAGCLSFEFSAGPQRLVVNCGLPATNREAWRSVARATAAHSTVVFNDTSSCRFLESGSFRRLFAGSPVIAGPNNVPVAREEPDGAIVVRASHDGYADRFGVIHQRTLMLSGDGSRLDGEDAFLPSEGDQMPRQDEFIVRFHLHPAVRATRLTDGHGAMLVLPDRDVWSFNAYEDLIELEESVYLAGQDGPRRATQIAIYGHARKVPRVRWSFSHRHPAAAEARNEPEDQAELPL